MAADSASQKPSWSMAGMRPVIDASRYSARWCALSGSDTVFQTYGTPFSSSAT